MRELVFLLEEESAKAMLQSLVPRFLDSTIVTRFIAFEGKQDLEANLLKRLRGYMNPDARFLVMRDQDSSSNCKELKAGLEARCRRAGRNRTSLIRIACRELETFYIADLPAVEAALGLSHVAKYQLTAKFRTPDKLGSPSMELSRLTRGSYQKVSGSRVIGLYLEIDNGRSPSFRNLIRGVRKLERQLLSIPNER